jgi:hypothetical protein
VETGAGAGCAAIPATTCSTLLFSGDCTPGTEAAGVAGPAEVAGVPEDEAATVFSRDTVFIGCAGGFTDCAAGLAGAVGAAAAAVTGGFAVT